LVCQTSLCAVERNVAKSVPSIMSSRQEVIFDSARVRCAADLYWPDNAADEKAPCVVVGHGGTPRNQYLATGEYGDGGSSPDPTVVPPAGDAMR